ncbi:hypothetical protein [Xenorhabdus innexi]|uniref:Uncharacterized protein n=1 Tax=Xenorhabdus innexi TaxID=290109 RepID=A0A1N6MR32_9GAMM|nr:hypothetical protein [Xenorhabdus innexi]PHM35686.1 hypothetical protein Xinn_02250 [Xenorhabdus innexi]SIP71302.1 conserved membrane hypothetical protein [Xenorhabdus innexi]
MIINNALTNKKFRYILDLYKNTDIRVKNGDFSLLDEINSVNPKTKLSINRLSEESVLLVLFSSLVFISYMTFISVLYDFYLSIDIAGLKRSTTIFIISITSVLTLYAYRGSLLALKILNRLNTLSIVLAIGLLLLNYFIYYMHHELYLLIIVLFNFFTNRIIINSEIFSRMMRGILWFKVNNLFLKKKIDKEENIVQHVDNYNKLNVFMIFWRYFILNENLNNVLKSSYALNQRVKKNDKTLLTERKLNKYRLLLRFDIPKKALLITLLSTILLIKFYVMVTFMLLFNLHNKNHLPILFFISSVALIFAFLSISLTHRGINLGFIMLTAARYLSFILFISLVGLKFIVNILDYSNISLCIIGLDLFMVFFMLNTKYYSNYIKELHYFQIWHKIIRKKL